jgi:hypothetical protein
LTDLLNNAGMANLTLPVASPDEEAASIMDNSKEAPISQSEEGFFILPIELRLPVYGHLFKSDKAIEFGKSDTSLSAHFLRTCKQVYKEGREILYGENSFHFTRDTRTRGTYHDKVWKEIGYKDIRRFLQDIGPVNVSHGSSLRLRLHKK